MKGKHKTQEQLVNELAELRQRIAELETSETERKQAEAERERLLAAEHEQRILAETLAEVTLALTSQTSHAAVLDEILRQAQRIVPYSMAKIMLLEGDALHAAHWQGYEPFGHEQSISNLVLPLADFPLDTEAIQSRKPLVIPDTHQHPRWVVLDEMAWTRSTVMVPICLRDRVLGLLTLDSDTPGEFSAQDAQRLQPLASAAAIALENARLFTATRRQAEQLEALRQVGLELTAQLDLDALLHSIVSRAVELLGGTAGGLNFYRPEQETLEWTAAVGPDVAPVGTVLHRGEGLSGRIWETGGPITVDDYQHWEGRAATWEGYPVWAAVGVPVRWGEEFLGVLIVASSSPRTFSPADAELLSLLATQAAIAIRNARLYEETQRRALEQRTLREAALALTTTLDRDEVIERILAQLQQVVPYDSASVQLLREDRLEIVGGRGFPNLPDLLGISFPADGDNPNKEVVRTRAPFIVEDAPAVYAGFREDPHLQTVIRSWLGVPMLVRERLAGIIVLDKREPGFYTQEHARLAEAFAAQAAIAVENSRLFQAERGQRELAEALEEAAATVSGTLDLDQVLDRILEQVERVVPGDTFNVMLLEGDVAQRVRWRGYEYLDEAGHVSRVAIPIVKYPSLLKMRDSGEPVVIPDTATDPNWTPSAGGEWRRSYVAAPIRVGDTTVGFLNVVSTQPGQFGPADARRLQAFADHAATAIENARLYQELQNYAELLEERVKERTAEIQAQYARLGAILRSASDGILVTDGQGEIFQANLVAETWLTRTLSPEDATWLRQAVQYLAQRAEERPETVLELKGLDLELKAAPISEPGGEEILRQAQDRPLWQAQGEPAAVVAVHDVSHLKALERMKTRFVTNISHELRTPITTIKLYAHLMQRTPPEDEKWGEYLTALALEADHQARLVQDILQISRIDAGRLEMRPEPTPLNQLTKAAVTNRRVLAQDRGLTLEHRPAEPGPATLVDPQRLMQVLENLVANAIQYTPEGGKVVVSTGKEETEGRVWATATVADTGMGIPEDELPHTFERFFRGEKPRQMQISGTGLGLAIVKEIVELHGGRVTVESQVGEGTTFTIWLPLAD